MPPLRRTHTLQGALSSRAYTNKSRPWQIARTPSRDIMDGVAPNIEAHARNNNLARIVPTPADGFNMGWLTDRSRHSIDGLTQQRLTHPLMRLGNRARTVIVSLLRILPAAYALSLKYGDTFYVERLFFALVSACATMKSFHWDIGWSDAHSVMSKTHALAPPGTIRTAPGYYTDLDMADRLRRFTSVSGSTRTTGTARAFPNDAARSVIDFRRLYSTDPNIHGDHPSHYATSAYICLFMNPLYESPILNITIRRSPQVFVFGYSDFDYSPTSCKLGNTMESVMGVINGKTSLPIASNIKSVHILHGEEFMRMAGAAAPRLLETLAMQLGRRYGVTVNFLHRECSIPAQLEAGLIPHWYDDDVHNTDHHHPPVAFELAHGCQGRTLAPAPFTVHMSSNGDAYRGVTSTLNLPTATHYEKARTWLSTFGTSVVTNRAVHPTFLVKEDCHAVDTYLHVVGARDPHPWEDTLPQPLATLDNGHHMPARIPRSGPASSSTSPGAKVRGGHTARYLTKENYYQQTAYTWQSVWLSQSRKQFKHSFDRMRERV